MGGGHLGRRWGWGATGTGGQWGTGRRAAVSEAGRRFGSEFGCHRPELFHKQKGRESCMVRARRCQGVMEKELTEPPEASV